MLFKNWFRHLALFVYHKIKNRGKVRFHYTSTMSHQCVFEGYNVIGEHTDFYGTMGLGSYILPYSHFSAYIGRFSCIGKYVYQIVERHPYKEPFVTTSAMFISQRKQTGHTFAKKQYFEEYKFYDQQREIAFKVGNDCWIGHEVCFVGGVEVGDGAVVLTRAMVTKDVPPYAIVGGVPAKVIGYRYDEATIEMLLRVKWWDKDVKWFEEHADLLCDMEKFKEYFSKNPTDIDSERRE